MPWNEPRGSLTDQSGLCPDRLYPGGRQGNRPQADPQRQELSQSRHAQSQWLYAAFSRTDARTTSKKARSRNRGYSDRRNATLFANAVKPSENKAPDQINWSGARYICAGDSRLGLPVFTRPSTRTAKNTFTFQSSAVRKGSVLGFRSYRTIASRPVQAELYDTGQRVLMRRQRFRCCDDLRLRVFRSLSAFPR